MANTQRVRAVPPQQEDNVLDLDAARAQRLEAGDGTVAVKFGGETFAFPNPKEWDVTFLDHLREGDFSNAVRVVLGDEDAWKRFMGHRPRLADVEELFERMGATAGVGGLGNSTGSANSSPPRRKR